MLLFWGLAIAIFGVQVLLIGYACFRSPLVGLVLGIFLTLALWAGLIVAGGGPLLAIGMVLYYGLVANAFFHYRHLRQEEVRFALGAAAESQAPLAPAVRAYGRDQARGVARRFWEGFLLNAVILGYSFTWHQHRYFNLRVHRLADLLEAGLPLSDALRLVPGVANRETALAAAVGESTGKLADALSQPPQTRLGLAALETVPRLAYPVFILVLQVGVTVFLMTFIVPKFEKIFIDFKLRLPWVTEAVLATYKRFYWLIPPLLFGLLGTAVALSISPTVRWWVPGPNWIFRKHAQGRILKMLGVMLGAGKPAPEALAVLATSDYLGAPAQRRLRRVQEEVENGQPLFAQLNRQGLLPASAMALLNAAERARNVPWALAEVGDHLSRRATQLWQRWSTVVGVVILLAVGVVVALTALAMFLPLIALLTELNL